MFESRRLSFPATSNSPNLYKSLTFPIGCSINEVLIAIDQQLDNSRSQSGDELIDIGRSASDHNARAHSTIWRWLTRRPEISVGQSRQFNHFSLDEVLRLRDAGGIGECQHVGSVTDGVVVNSQAPQVHATMDAQWECIAGHPQDFTRVLQLEWHLLQGVASSRSEGILQGDLCRLANQDKRSVPKRTDSLVKKGYLTKRTTLVRGTKTSKMWLRSLAPSLAQGEGAASSAEQSRKTPQQTLTTGLEPVPWSGQWVGQSLDYSALTTTTMAIIKKWGVIRILHLKLKLGVLGKRWHMKVLAKLCRALNAQGAIQYTAATLDGRVFKDCIQFTRDLVPQDLTVLFAAGKKREQPVEPSYDMDKQDLDPEEHLTMQGINAAQLASLPMWAPDKPLASLITNIATYFESQGVTNPELISLSLGPSFSRFIASLTSSFATAGLQPRHLTHLRMTSEHKREGKVASYRYFILPQEQNVPQGLQDLSEDACHSLGFSSQPSPGLKMRSLTFLAGAGQALARSAGKPDHERAETSFEEHEGSTIKVDDTEAVLGHISHARDEKETSPDASAMQRSNSKQPSEARARFSHTDPEGPFIPKTEAQADAEHGDTILPVQSAVERSAAVPDGTEVPQEDEVTDGGQPTEELHTSQPTERGGARGRGRGRVRGRGRGKRGKSQATGARLGVKPWVCEKCGGSWKNDIGLKYHQEKARTSCNPSFDPMAETPKRGKKPKHTTLGLEDDLDKAAGLPEMESNAGARRLRKRQHNSVTPGLGDGISISSDEEDDSYIAHNQRGNTSWRGSVIGRRPEKGVKSINQPPSRGRRRHTNGEALLSLNHMDQTMNAGEEFETTALGLLSPGQPDLPTLSEAADRESVHRELNSEIQAKSPTHNSATIVQRDPEPAMQLPATVAEPSNEAGSQKLSKVEINKRVTHIIDGCFTKDDVVLPGGDVIIRIIQSIWSRQYHDEHDLTQKECQSALRSLFRKKTIAEHWHAFRNRFGSFSKSQVIMKPQTDPFSGPSMEVVEKMKLAHPRLYFPKEYASLTEQTGRPGRRNLPTEVAILDAPVYAAQVAVKRALADEEKKASRPRKRRNWGSEDGRHQSDRETSPAWIALNNGVQWMPQYRPLEHLDTDSAYALMRASPGFEVEELHFLEPNTYLDAVDEPIAVVGDSGILTTESDVHQDTMLTGVASSEYQLVDSILVIQGSQGVWPELDAVDFEDDGLSFTMNGWIPDSTWHLWVSRARQMAKAPKAPKGSSTKSGASAESHYERFCQHLEKVRKLESSRANDFVQSSPRSAGPYNIFITFEGVSPRATSPQSQLVWDSEMTGNVWVVSETSSQSDSSDSGQDELNIDPKLQASYEGISNNKLASYANLIGVKRVMLTTRNLTVVPHDAETQDLEGTSVTEGHDDTDELLAAFVAVRALLGGIEKRIDWGILATLFPHIGAEGLREHWQRLSQEYGHYIETYTQDFHDRFLEAYEKGDLPTLDFGEPSSYDWGSLISWTMDIANETSHDIPADLNTFQQKFNIEDPLEKLADWRNDFFHPQSSLFARFEWAVSEPGAVEMSRSLKDSGDVGSVSDLVIVRSWVRSLCCATEGLFSPEEIKNKFLSISMDDSEYANALLATAIQQLTQEKAIRRNPKPPLGGRPYHLSESFNTTLDKLAQREKYLQAASCKTRIDAAFRRKEPFRISYSLGDGAIMAVTSLNAAQRVILRPVELPDIPYGFEPGNYESRKYPKRYYHFELEVVPTDNYLYNEDVNVLAEITRQGPAVGSASGELPQWIDFSGRVDHERWSNVLAALCFSLATRGPMTIGAMCDALDPVLEPAEAMSIIRWAKITGVLKSLASGVGTTVGEWWWLAVPHVMSHRSR